MPRKKPKDPFSPTGPLGPRLEESLPGTIPKKKPSRPGPTKERAEELRKQQTTVPSGPIKTRRGGGVSPVEITPAEAERMRIAEQRATYAQLQADMVKSQAQLDLIAQARIAELDPEAEDRGTLLTVGTSNILPFTPGNTADQFDTGSPVINVMVTGALAAGGPVKKGAIAATRLIAGPTKTAATKLLKVGMKGLKDLKKVTVGAVHVEDLIAVNSKSAKVTKTWIMKLAKAMKNPKLVASTIVLAIGSYPFTGFLR